MIFVQTLVILVCSFSVIKADGACRAKMGQDIIKELMNLMLKVKCQSSGDNEIQTKPAFVAFLTKTTTLSENVVIKFDDVITNIGNGYNAATGIFMAPESGIYEFSANILKSSTNHWLHFDLMKNEKIVARGLCSKSAHSSGSIRVIVELIRGDRIFVKNPGNTAIIYGNKYSMFSGHLM